MNVLVIEDDPVIGKALRQGFVEGGSDCVWAKDGVRGLEMASSQQYDVIILDLMLPGTARPRRARTSCARKGCRRR